MAKPPRENEQGADSLAPAGEAEARPGAYVEMVSAPRRRRSSGSLAPDKTQADGHSTEQIRLPSGAVAYVSQPVPRASGAPRPMGISSAPPIARELPVADAPCSEEVRIDAAIHDARPTAYGAPKAITEVVMASREDARSEAENTNRRADIVLPAFYSPMEPRISERPLATSVLDAKPQFHSDPPEQKQTPWGMMVAASLLSSIIAAALVVFVLESRSGSIQSEDATGTAAAEHRAPPALPALNALPAAQEPAPSAVEHLVAPPSGGSLPVLGTPAAVVVAEPSDSPAGDDTKSSRSGRSRRSSHGEESAAASDDANEASASQPTGQTEPIARASAAESAERTASAAATPVPAPVADAPKAESAAASARADEAAAIPDNPF